MAPNIAFYEHLEKLANLPIQELREHASDDEIMSRGSMLAQGLLHKTRGSLMRIVLERDRDGESDDTD